jgi:hypothetical protein
MRLWSKGLGRLVLPLELSCARVDLTPEHVVLSGTIREGKVAWEYAVRLTEEDLLSFSRLATDREILSYLARTHGSGLLWTITTRTFGFLRGLARAAIGRGAAVRSEETLEVGPPRPRKRGRRSDGVLVQGTR